MLTLAAALNRIIDNEGGTPNCELLLDVEGLTPGTICSVETLARRPAGEAEQEIYRVDRSMKNWQILRNGEPCLRAHPWDESPNVAYLTAGRGVSKAVGETLVEECERLAQRLEKLGLIGEACVLWRTCLSICTRIGDARLPYAREQATRTQQLIQAQTVASREAPAAAQ